MDILADVGILVQGGLTGYQVYVMMQIQSLKQQIEDEKQHNINLAKKIEANNKEFDKRLKNVELMGSKYWSKFNCD